MKTALAAKPVIDRDTEHNLCVMIQTLKDIAGQTDLVLFGEAALQGFDALTWDPAQDSRIALSQDSDAIAALREAAKAFQTAVCCRVRRPGIPRRCGSAVCRPSLRHTGDGARNHRVRGCV